MTYCFNQVTLIGNLTRDPETQATTGGSEVCRFSLALNRVYKTPEGESRESVDFVNISAWDGLGKIVQNYCHKGKQVFIQGRLKSSSWEQDGRTRNKLEVIANNIILLGGRTGDGQGSPSGEGYQVDGQNKSSSKNDKEEVIDYELDTDFRSDNIDDADIPF